MIRLEDPLVPATTAEVGAILCVTGLAIAPVAAALVRRFFPAQSVLPVRFGFAHVAQVVLLAALLLAAIAALRGSSAPEDPLADLVLTAGVLGVCSAYVAILAARLDPGGIRCLGLSPDRQLRAAVAGMLAYGMLLPALLGVGILWPFLLDAIGFAYEPQLVLEKMRELGPGQRPMAVLLGCALMPLFEEVLFRAFLQPLFVRVLPEAVGVVVTSLVFAALHGTGAFLPIFVLSLVLGGVMLRTQRLLAVWSVHALHNGLMFLLLYR